MRATPSAHQIANDCATIRSSAAKVGRTYPQAHEIVFSPRRTGEEKTRGGYTPDSTGERAACECGGENDKGEPIGGRDPVTGHIRHVCAPPELRKAGSEVHRAKLALQRAQEIIDRIAGNSDHHDERTQGHVKAPHHDPKGFKPSADVIQARSVRADKILDRLADEYRRDLLEAGFPADEAAARSNHIFRAGKDHGTIVVKTAQREEAKRKEAQNREDLRKADAA